MSARVIPGLSDPNISSTSAIDFVSVEFAAAARSSCVEESMGTGVRGTWPWAASPVMRNMANTIRLIFTAIPSRLRAAHNHFAHWCDFRPAPQLFPGFSKRGLDCRERQQQG